MAQIASSFEKQGNIAVGTILTDAMRKIAEASKWNIEQQLSQDPEWRNLPSWQREVKRQQLLDSLMPSGKDMPPSMLQIVDSSSDITDDKKYKKLH